MIQEIDPQVPPDDANFVLFPNYQPNNEDPKRKTEGRGPKAYPKDAPPETLLLPKKDKPTAGRYIEAKSHGRLLTLVTKREKPVLPGWLIELDNAMLSACMDLKDIISMGSDLEEMTKRIHRIVCKEIGLEMTASAILEVLRRVPDASGSGLSFPHFMFAMGNFSLAEKKHLLLNNQRPYNGKKFDDGDDDGKSKEKKKEKKRDANKAGPSGYTPCEQVFFSGLLIFEMYDTIAHVEDVYYKSKMPEPQEVEEKRNLARGFGVQSIGFKKRGVAAWDMPLPPLPKRSPYLSSMPFVTTRWKIVKPSVNDRGRRRTFASNRPLHMMIQGPDTHTHISKAKVRILENKRRIHQAMVYLASQGDVVAMLPNSHFLINISDTIIQKMEDYKELMPNKETEIICPSNDESWISRHAKELYRPHGVPAQVTKMPLMIRFSDAINLRAICKLIREQHWAFVSDQHKIFREECWKRMHVDRMPYGRLRDSFIYSFVTYMPLTPDLPIVHNKGALPY